MKIIDAHTHIFPNKIAAKASENIGKFYDLAMGFDGRADKLIEICKENNISRSLICSVATRAQQTRSINAFINDTKNENDLFFGLISVHPDNTEEEIDFEINFALENELKGIKLHPDFQEFQIDDRKAYKIYERAEGKLPILIHTGDSRYDFSGPERLLSMKKDFPKLQVIAAHFGGWSVWGEAVKCLSGKENIYFDTSSSLYNVTPKDALEFINALGADNVLFGTDYPMWNAKDELVRIKKIGLSQNDLEKILYKNAERVFQLSHIDSKNT